MSAGANDQLNETVGRRVRRKEALHDACEDGDAVRDEALLVDFQRDLDPAHHRRLRRSRHECHDRPVLEARDAVDVLRLRRRKLRELLKQLLEGRQPGLSQP